MAEELRGLRKRRDDRLAGYGTRELWAELEVRMQGWPAGFFAARAFLRGAWKALEDAVQKDPDPRVSAVLDRQRPGWGR